MSEFRLLPCPACGQAIRVGLSQAGQAITCPCGQQVEVPPLRLLRELEIAPAAEVPSRKPGWSLRHMLTLIGIVIIFVGIATGYVFWSTTPRPRPVETMSPAELWELWQFYQTRGLPRRYVRNDPFVQEMQARRLWLIFAGVIVFAGVAVVALARYLPMWFTEKPAATDEEPEPDKVEGGQPGDQPVRL